MVTGIVAEDEVVEKAVISAGNMALKCFIGLTLANIFKIKGRNIKVKQI